MWGKIVRCANTLREGLGGVGGLPETLEYSGEYGTELVCFVPFIYWLHLKRLLGNHRVMTYNGMRPYYFFLDNQLYDEKSDQREFVPWDRRPNYLPNPIVHFAQKTSREVYPDYRSAYANKINLSEKPLLIVLNKYCEEWGLGPINYIPLEALDQIFSRFCSDYQIIYMREGQGTVDLQALGFSPDQNHPRQFGDDALLRKHREVISFQTLVRDYSEQYSYNELKLMLFSDCRHYISSQGGGCNLAALMPSNTMLILHRCGFEVKHSYVNGYYRYGATPGPTLLVASKTRELVEALRIFDGAKSQSEIEGDPGLSSILQALHPQRLHDPHHEITWPAEW